MSHFLVVLAGFLALPAHATACGETAEARVEAADRLIGEARSAEAIDQAAILERAQILLEKTLEEEPTCKSAQTLLTLTETLEPELESVSNQASMDRALTQAAETLDLLETGGVTNPAVLETLRFQLAELARSLGDDDQLAALTERAVALSDAP